MNCTALLDPAGGGTLKVWGPIQGPDWMQAHLSQADVALRRHALWDARGQRLLERLVTVSGWAAHKLGQGWGAALTWCFENWVGQVVKVGPRAGAGVAVERVWAVIDRGVAAKPHGVKAQVEGSIVMALGAAVHHAVRFEGSRTVARNFDAYPMRRLADLPGIEVHVLDDDSSPPGGAGGPAPPTARSLLPLHTAQVPREIGRWRYSNTGFAMAAAIINAVSGLDHERYMRERIFAPQG